MRKYQIGEKVTVKSKEFFLNHEKYLKGEVMESPYFIRDMFECCGKTYTIKNIPSLGVYTFKGMGYKWGGWMFISRNEKLEKILNNEI